MLRTSPSSAPDVFEATVTPNGANEWLRLIVQRGTPGGGEIKNESRNDKQNTGTVHVIKSIFNECNLFFFFFFFFF